jgi:hypothetical protein
MGVDGQRQTLDALPLGNRPIVQDAVWAPGPAWTSAERSYRIIMSIQINNHKSILVTIYTTSFNIVKAAILPTEHVLCTDIIPKQIPSEHKYFVIIFQVIIEKA